ncbi:Outer membrane receptor proteins, mostly Fe transport [Mesonia phycicola]|uniref:Outer membrane receptor proteins, mostly Fe transport n=1 Tax=Mesonia phycicola TaxID=579105 RepID=A0A1M6GZW6_9FLAO|nr:carboxypeptidase-like regulatory domain-containing protein [Mesonia phycicola]SHJ15486.1 Outer membrane receptor proteins, mostly Fe transport [Mesonia phycicola]
MRIVVAILLLITNISAYAQVNSNRQIKGLITDITGEPIVGVTVMLQNTSKGDATDFDGNYLIKNIPQGNYTLQVSAIGFQSQNIAIEVKQKNIIKNITLVEDTSQLSKVLITSKTKAVKMEEHGFSVDAIETQKIKSQSLEINKILDNTPGVRVRTTGGIGSDFEYSLDGMSGNAIRFFIDGIPMDYYGSSYSINNLPVSLIERIEIYKGVVPVELGSDALGGAINLVTKEKLTNFAEASYSFGSFNTHKIAVHGQWRFNSGFTTRLSTFYTYSDNNYKVWGEGVFYGDESTGFQIVEFTEDNPAERFNDDFETVSAKLDLGFTQKKWADQFFVTLLASDLKKGVQTAQTMSRVFGKVRNNEQTFMPSIIYKKKNLFTDGLDVNAFAAYSYTESKVIDTSYIQYDWRGEEIGYRASGGEMGYDGRSLFTQKDNSQIYRLNTTYQLPYQFKLGLNYVYSGLKRSGEDPYTPEYRIPYIEPQNIASHFAGLSLETLKFQDKLRTNLFVKFYDYTATINDLEYTDQYEIIEYKNNITNWGVGYAASYRFSNNFLLKTSLEKAARMPSPTEALGDGVTVSNNPFIKPERSFNINLGTILGRYSIAENHGLKISLNSFYRDTKDKLLFTVLDARDNGQFQNVDRISGLGGEIDFIYDFKQKLKFNLNATYLDLRNNLEYEEDGTKNIFYKDRMRNTPYLLANAGINYTTNNILQKNSKIYTYFQSSYVHEFYLDWPSAAAAENKRTIPTQLVFDAGMSYTFPSQNFTLAFDVSNILNEQVYDNYRLQKPGRAMFIKINYQISE